MLLLGGAPGIVLGGVGAWLAGRAWVDAPAALPGPGAVLAGLAIVAVGLVAVLVGMAGALREPLSRPGQHRRPSPRRLDGGASSATC